jgi:molybdopterin/thiamine biosynthesis adenylyltransferase
MENSSETIHISSDNRFERFELINWWEQKRLREAKVLVVGAGALGNEILKNLALLGFGNIIIVDMDKIENSNLSRSILFRAEDQGDFKAEVAAKAIINIYPDINVKSIVGNIIYDIGLGIFNWADIVIAGLDNREARLVINRNCWKLNKPWIDGAIEQLNGIARVFIPPDGACYECTMSEVDWKIIKDRRACTGLTREELLMGKIPTTPTSGSIIAAIQCQEAVKLIHGLEVLKSKGYYFNGLSHDSYIITYSRKEDCSSHETFTNIIKTGKSVKQTKISDLLLDVKSILGNEAVIDFNFEIISEVNCPACEQIEAIFRPIDDLAEGELVCKKCGTIRIMNIFHSIDGTENFLDRYFSDIGIPSYDIISGRNGLEKTHLIFDGDENILTGLLNENKE